MNKDLNKQLYADKLLKTWSEKTGLLSEETYLFDKYLTNTKNGVLEAGTGGGRIIFEIEKRGFINLEAFDFVDKMITISITKKEELNSKVSFNLADATNLTDYQNDHYDYLIYLQQVLCFVGEEYFEKALSEALRIGKKDSLYLFSFLNWDSKSYNPLLSRLVNLFRALRGEKKTKYLLPWLVIDGKFNWKLLAKNQPQNLWFIKKTIIAVLEKVGFEILELKTGAEIKGDSPHQNGQFYVVCKKNS